MKKKSKMAFTLVELAIVIVIIGLLVSGVLVGQELIAQAKIRAQLQQLEGYNAALLTFKSKYDYLPGDIPIAHANKFGIASGSGSSAVPPNGDGLIGDGNGNVPPLAFYPEPRYFFIHLSQVKLVKEVLGFESNSSAIGDTYPEDRLGKGGIAAISLREGGVWFFMGPTRRSTSGNTAIYLSENPSVTPSQALTIETKIDDGHPGVGSVRAVIVTSSVSTTFTNDVTPANNCVNTDLAGYNVSGVNSEKPTCRLIIKTAS
jgi:type II secretory pathway pseudopilin PulG